MKNRIFEVLLIILLIDVFLLAASFAPEVSIPIPVAEEEVNLKFLGYTALTDFDYKENSQTADSLINVYLDSNDVDNGLLHRTSLTALSPKIKNTFLVNRLPDNTYALDNFFHSLLKEKDKDVVRIAHYGDSQLEGDRITCYVRNNFQQKFGGTGVGFVPLEDIATNMNLARVSSPNWMRYTVFHNRYSGGYYGLSGNVYKFSKYAVIRKKRDTLENGGLDSSAAKLNLSRVYDKATVAITLNPSVSYRNAYLMYGRSTQECKLKVFNQTSNEQLLSETLKPSSGFVKHKLDFPASVRSFKLEFAGDESPDFYGLLIEGDHGVQMDNYAIRGHSGDGLLLINPEYLAQQLKELRVKLVIFQYGNNVVPYAKSEKACAHLEKMYTDIFSRFKKAAPDISVLVIGAGDMASKVEGEYASYPFIPKVRDAQKNAAIKTGCAFWDLYEVMGGMNAVINWSKNGLASHDGHFTAKGQRVIGRELFNALMVEYNQYKFRQRKKENA